MVIPSFISARIPQIYFGVGNFSRLGKIVREMGNRLLVVTGYRSLKSSGKWDHLVKLLKNESIHYYHIWIEREPSPEDIDEAVVEFRGKNIDVILAVGGGSVLDTGKAISAMLPQNQSVVNFLEGVGTGEEHNGIKVPFVAVPTTSGTGSEVTKNAVLSQIGPDGYKKSIRHDNFVPDVALIDPELMLSCPSGVTASTGMDACTQLLEGFVSPKASPFTDVLAYDGLKYIRDNLVLVCTTHAKDVEIRTGMAYAALLSGIVLANAGLGIVHGLASPIGGHFPMPHGEACGTLLASATRKNIKTLMEKGDETVALRKYASVGWLFSGKKNGTVQKGCDMLIKILDDWTEQLNLPHLSHYGMNTGDLDNIVKETEHKSNPVHLHSEQIKNILQSRI